MPESITFVVTEPFEYSPPAVWERIVYSSDLSELFMPLGTYYGVGPSFFADDKQIDFTVYLAPDVTVPCWLVTDSKGSLVGAYGIQSCIGSRTGAFESTWVVSVPDEIKHLFGQITRVVYWRSNRGYAWWKKQYPDWENMESVSLQYRGWSQFYETPHPEDKPLRTSDRVFSAYGERIGVTPVSNGTKVEYPLPRIEYQMVVHVDLLNNRQMKVYNLDGSLLCDSALLDWIQHPEFTDAVYADLTVKRDMFWTRRTLCEEETAT